MKWIVLVIGSLDVLNALDQTAELIGKAGVPDGFVLRHFHEVMILKCLSGQFINDGADECLLGGMRLFRILEHVRGHGISSRVL